MRHTDLHERGQGGMDLHPGKDDGYCCGNGNVTGI